jgi:glycine betaine/proline transport system substrate-binding protein
MSVLRRVSIYWFIPVAVLVFALVLAACNGDDDAVVDDVTDDVEEVDDDDVEVGAADWDEPITFADYGWDSALALNRIAQFILEEGYGYETDTVPGETIPLFEGLRRGDIQVSMEIWVDQQPEWQGAVDDGTLLDHGTSFGESIQGWFVPTYVIEGDDDRGIEPMAPDLQHVDDLPDYWELFQDPEDRNKGRFYDCIAGWECEKVNEAKFYSYGLDETYNRFLPGSGAALDTSLVAAYERGEPWLGYYWGPSWIFGQLDLTMLDEPEYTEECWDEVIEAADAGQVPDEACAYPAVPVHISTNSEFAEQAPDVIEFLESFNLTMDDVSEILLYMADEDEEAEGGAQWFLRERTDLWHDWVPDEVIERVEAALN